MKTLSKVCNKVTQLRLAWLKGSGLLIHLPLFLQPFLGLKRLEQQPGT